MQLSEKKLEKHNADGCYSHQCNRFDQSHTGAKQLLAIAVV